MEISGQQHILSALVLEKNPVNKREHEEDWRKTWWKV